MRFDRKAAPSNARRTAIDYSHVGSDVFDSFSKQLIPVETLLPDVHAHLEKVNASITKEEKSIKVSLMEIAVSALLVVTLTLCQICCDRPSRSFVSMSLTLPRINCSRAYGIFCITSAGSVCGATSRQTFSSLLQSRFRLSIG